MYARFGVCWPESLVIFDHDKALWILESEKVASTSLDFTRKVILAGKEKEFYNLWKQGASTLKKVQKDIDQIEISDISDQDLAEIFSKWSKAYLDFWAIGMTAELINYGLEYKIKSLLRPKFADERDFNEAFAILTTPTALSFYKQEELDLMRIVLSDVGERSLRLEGHREKYYWIYNNYLEAKMLDIPHFAERIKGMKESDAEKFLAEFTGYEEKISAQKEQLYDSLQLETGEIGIIDSLNNSMTFQDDRKKYNLIANQYLENFLIEIGRRHGIKVRDLKWLLPVEIEAMAKGKDLSKIIEQRKNITTINCDRAQLSIETGNQASKIQKLFDGAEFDRSANLQGTVACTGKSRYFRGIARIILSPKAGDKLKEGEILVTSMTTPDFVVLMNRAGAIITDFGGVTCHAAVVSREFGIPCIVGTENATKAIKDGDILELHNLRGTVKIIPV